MVALQGKLPPVNSGRLFIKGGSLDLPISKKEQETEMGIRKKKRMERRRRKGEKRKRRKGQKKKE
jgi:hypothetical protein